MKKDFFFYMAMSLLFFVVTSFEYGQTSNTNPSPGDDFMFPEDVQTILDKSCFGCHNVDAKSDKAKKKLLLDKMGELSKAKLVGKLSEISEVVKEEEMPPSKFLQKYPDKALTEEEANRLVEWTETATEEIMN